MKPEHIIERQGKRFVVYAGLLDAAHDAGLKRITTAAVQLPNDANGQTAIVHATVELEGSKEFSAYGDANPGNAGPVARNAVLRLAETRAKARALRDATNCAAAAIEELDDLDDAHPVAYTTPEQPSAARNAASNGYHAAPSPPAVSTDVAPLRAAWNALVFDAQALGLRAPIDPPDTALERAIASLQDQVNRERGRRAEPTRSRR